MFILSIYKHKLPLHIGQLPELSIWRKKKPFYSLYFDSVLEWIRRLFLFVSCLFIVELLLLFGQL